ncbi:hypothetical protein [Methylobacter sp. S3L5C]|uniref:hypothetical protein n=1 Tax=Methylobacter sp. S3L5C TaxID=2839024 RepID=UPI001FACF03B|nr:hypothetical protein [Methylobacter sp. S3L5C]UOA09944.1 hypothetical protein KKZ03_06725 [Methylobacter sp. S3L5C]
MIYGKRQPLQFLEAELTEYRNYSDENARIIDTEIIILIKEGAPRSGDNHHKPQLVGKTG